MFVRTSLHLPDATTNFNFMLALRSFFSGPESSYSYHKNEKYSVAILLIEWIESCFLNEVPM